ncbi:MAG: diadenylate cyclase CdaA [Clostridia bacterium]|nr:diadenylate cyclase CdaA [Clostridia bacterium]
MDKIQTFFANLGGVLSSFDSIGDILDIVLVAVVLYALFVQLRKTQSVHIIRGILLLAVVYAVVVVLQMETSKYIFNTFIRDILLIIVIIFSTEIRHALERMGHSSVKNLFSFGQRDDTAVTEAVNATVRACASMSEDKIGSLIVFRRRSNLGELEKSGVYIDAKVTTEMLCSIFFPKAALHDGAIVIEDDRITAARCIVSMRNDIVITEKVGTRHRAALAVSQNTDAVVVVTSEETGIISVAVEGVLKRGITPGELRELLMQYLLPDTDGASKLPARLKKKIRKGGGKHGGKTETADDNTDWDDFDAVGTDAEGKG